MRSLLSILVFAAIFIPTFALYKPQKYVRVKNALSGYSLLALYAGQKEGEGDLVSTIFSTRVLILFIYFHLLSSMKQTVMF